MHTVDLDMDAFVPVPVRFVEQVAAYVTELKAGRTVTATDDSVETVAVPDQGEWTQKMTEQLAAEVTYEGVLALIDRCGEKPGVWVPKSEVEESIGMDPLRLRNQLGALSKTTKRLFGRVTWPMQWKKDGDRYIYKMDPTIAKWWTEARKSA